jgi:hypothetical protein
VSAEPAEGPGGGRDREHGAAPGQGPVPGRDGGGDCAGPAGFPAGAGAGGYVWGLEDARAGADPLSSPPPEYVGVPLREIFAGADAGTQPPEAWDAGFRAGPGGGRVRRRRHRAGGPVCRGDR